MPITPQDLVSTVATLLDMPVNTVKNYDRKLMEAGLRTKKGHGRGSAIMSPRDAAMLLVAIASNDEITRAAEGTSKTRELPLTARADPSILCRLIGGTRRDYATFGIAVDAVMKHLADKDRDEVATIQVHLQSGRPYRASLWIHHKGQNYEVKFESPREETNALLVSSGLRGLNVSRTILGGNIHYLAGCIAGRDPVLQPGGAGG